MVAVIVAILVADAQPEKKEELQKRYGRQKKQPEMPRKQSGMQERQSGTQEKPPAVTEVPVSLHHQDIPDLTIIPAIVEDNPGELVDEKEVL